MDGDIQITVTQPDQTVPVLEDADPIAVDCVETPTPAAIQIEDPQGEMQVTVIGEDAIALTIQDDSPIGVAVEVDSPLTVVVGDAPQGPQGVPGLDADEDLSIFYALAFGGGAL